MLGFLRVARTLAAAGVRVHGPLGFGCQRAGAAHSWGGWLEANLLDTCASPHCLCSAARVAVLGQSGPVSAVTTGCLPRVLRIAAGVNPVSTSTAVLNLQPYVSGGGVESCRGFGWGRTLSRHSASLESQPGFSGPQERFLPEVCGHLLCPTCRHSWAGVLLVSGSFPPV